MVPEVERPARVFPVAVTPDGNVFPRDGSLAACPADMLIMTITCPETLYSCPARASSEEVRPA